MAKIKMPTLSPLTFPKSPAGLPKLEEQLRKQSAKLQPFRYSGPTGQAGRWSIESFEVTALNLRILELVRDGGRGFAPGRYHRMIRRNEEGRKPVIVMSDTDAELMDFMNDMRDVSGSVLVGGMGMGLVLKAMMLTGRVKSITVVEIDRDLIGFVGPYVRELATANNVSVSIHHGDMMDWRPERSARFDWAWFDIWDEISDENLLDMRTLRKRFTKQISNIRCWCEAQCKYMEQGVPPRMWA